MASRRWRDRWLAGAVTATMRGSLGGWDVVEGPGEYGRDCLAGVAVAPVLMQECVGDAEVAGPFLWAEAHKASGGIGLAKGDGESSGAAERSCIGAAPCRRQIQRPVEVALDVWVGKESGAGGPRR